MAEIAGESSIKDESVIINKSFFFIMTNHSGECNTMIERRERRVTKERVQSSECIVNWYDEENDFAARQKAIVFSPNRLREHFNRLRRDPFTSKFFPDCFSRG